MKKIKDITGQKFGYLVAVKFIKRENNRTYWLCRCECGNECIAYTSQLAKGDKVSCGCKQNKIHGLTYTRLHTIWDSMKKRCFDSNRREYKWYGGKGITVCDEWKNSFISFYEWATTNGYREDLSIDRIDHNGNYEPSNCRWVDSKAQSHNKSNNHWITYQGKTKLVSEWAKDYGMDTGTLCWRLKNGWDLGKALETPVQKKR